MNNAYFTIRSLKWSIMHFITRPDLWPVRSTNGYIEVYFREWIDGILYASDCHNSYNNFVHITYTLYHEGHMNDLLLFR